MPKFRKKPVVIEAIQITDMTTTQEVKAFAPNVVCHFEANVPSVEIETLEGIMQARVGDWIIKGVAGEYYPCKPEIFAATYEAV